MPSAPDAMEGKKHREFQTLQLHMEGVGQKPTRRDGTKARACKQALSTTQHLAKSRPVRLRSGAGAPT